MKISRFISCLLVAVAVGGALVAPAPVVAKEKKPHTVSAKHKTKVRKRSVASQPLPPFARQYSALVVDASSGKVIYSENAGGIRFPASLTKMMTLYLTFDALKHGTLSLNDRVPVSAKAAGQPQTNIALNEGDRLPVRTAVESVVVRSANDSAMVLAEALGGTEWNFALMMTKKAHELGMKNTVFRNPSGLPDNRQYTTAYDMARLAIALRRDFPEYYSFFKLTSFAYNGITYPGHNHVMERYDGVDGVKTGYTRASGYNLVTSARKDGMNLVAVVMGGSTINARDDQMIALLDDAFEKLSERRRLAKKNGEDEPETQAAQGDDAKNVAQAAY